MSYIDPVTHSNYPTPVVEPVEEEPADETERTEREEPAKESERPYEEWDDDLGHNVDTSV